MSAHWTHADKKLARDPAGSSGAVQQLAYLLLCQDPRLREPAEGLSTKSPMRGSVTSGRTVSERVAEDAWNLLDWVRL